MDYSFIFKGKPYHISSNFNDFLNFGRIDPTISKLLLTKQAYNVKSDVNESTFQSFMDFLINKNTPDLTPENIMEYEQLSKEFDLMKELIEKFNSTRNYMMYEDENNKFSNENFTFEINEDEKTASIIDCRTENENIFIPRSVNFHSIEYIITSIGAKAFRFSKIKTIQFAEDSELKEIGMKAFASSDLECILIPPHVHTIGDAAFYGCQMLKTFDVPANSELKSMGNDVFSQSSLKTINIPQNLDDFKGFNYNKTPNLTDFSISPFNSNISLVGEKYTIWNSEKDSNFFVLLSARRDIEEAIIPYCINQIAPYAFDECKQLKKVIFTENSNLQIIGENAFRETDIECISIPCHVTQIGKGAFSKCKKLTNVTFIGESELQLIDDQAFSDTQIQSIQIPNHVKRIGCYAFQGCQNLDQIIFTDDSELEIIDNYAFAYSSIKQIEIPPHVKVIGDNAFAYCYNLDVCDASKSMELEIIGVYSFFKSSIKTLVIQSCVSQICPKWCSEANELHNIIIFPQSVQNIVSFEDKFILGKSNLKSDVFDVLLFARRDIVKVIIPPFITEIASYAFCKCTKLESVIFPNDSMLRFIEEFAFAYTPIKEINIPSHVKYIGEYAFNKCDQLETVRFADNSELISIDDFSFCGCQFRYISIPASVIRIGEESFSDCTNLDFVEFPRNSNLQCIDEKAFYRTKIKKISFPSSLSVIGKNAFAFCRDIQVIEFPSNPEYRRVTNNQFNFSSVERILIPPNIEQFQDCWCKEATKLKFFNISEENPSLANYQNDFIIGKSDPANDIPDVLVFARRDIQMAKIPAFIKKIAPFAFDHCDQLREIEFEENSELQIIDRNAFSKTSLCGIVFPPHLTCIDENAFEQNVNLKYIVFPENSEIQYIDKSAFYRTMIDDIICSPDVRKLIPEDF